MSIDAYLNFNGNCREVLEYYASVFKIKPYIMTFGEMPPSPSFPVSEEIKDLVMHASFDLYGSKLMFSDSMPDSPITLGNNINLMVQIDQPDEIRRVFKLLESDGEVVMPLTKTFWAELYGSVTDKFGVVWQFDYEVDNK